MCVVSLWQLAKSFLPDISMSTAPILEHPWVPKIPMAHWTAGHLHHRLPMED
jgi:hypothetical protein